MDPTVAPALKASPLVDYIEPRQWRHVQGVPGMNVLAFLNLGTPQTVPWGIQLVRAPDAWTVTRGAGVKVELIDTGHDRGHEDLPLVPTLNCSGAYGGCDDAYPIPHGTHVLGIWTARDNSVGVEGVAPSIAPADVYVYGACSSETGSCPTTDVTAGINAAIFTAKVVNMSLSGTAYDAGEANAVAQAWNNDIVLVAAAGNVPDVAPGTIVYPANYANVIGVAGVQTNKSFASTSPCVLQDGTHASSNYGPHVDLAAPFWALSTVPGGYDDETGGWCGTSMATPHVSGAAALLRAYHPDWTNQQVVNQLTSTALDLGAAGRDNYYGYGLVDAAAALGIPRPQPPSVSVTGPQTGNAYSYVTVTATASGGTPPYNYAWTIDGGLACSNQSSCTGRLGAPDTWTTFRGHGDGREAATGVRIARCVRVHDPLSDRQCIEGRGCTGGAVPLTCGHALSESGVNLLRPAGDEGQPSPFPAGRRGRLSGVTARGAVTGRPTT